MSNFGNVNIKIADGAQAVTSSGCTLWSNNGSLSFSNASNSYGLLTNIDTTQGNILVANGVTYTPLAFGGLSEVLTSNGSSPSWEYNSSLANGLNIYSGSAGWTGPVMTINNAAIQSTSKVLVCALSSDVGFNSNFTVTSISNGTFTMNTNANPATASGVYYFFTSSISHVSKPIFFGTLQLTFNAGANGWIGTYYNPNIMVSTNVVCNAIGTHEAEVGSICISNVSAGSISFHLGATSAAEGAVIFMYQ